MADTGHLINREALLGRNMPFGCDSSEADPDKSAAYNFWLGFEKARATIAELIHNEPAVDAEVVVYCKNCPRCKIYGDGHSFSCSEYETDFYAPAYDAATYFCADGKRIKAEREGAASA